MRKIQKVWRISIEELEMQFRDKVTLVMSMTMQIADLGDWSKLTVHGRKKAMEEEEHGIHRQELAEWEQSEYQGLGGRPRRAPWSPRVQGTFHVGRSREGPYSDQSRRHATVITRGHAEMQRGVTLRWTECSRKLCTIVRQRNKQGGTTPHMVLSCPRDDLPRFWDAKVDHGSSWEPGDAAQCLTREEAERARITNDVVMPTWGDAEVDQNHSWEPYSPTEHLIEEEEERGPITNGLTMPVWWDAPRCWDTKVDQNHLWEPYSTTGHLIEEEEERSPITNGLPMPLWWDAPRCWDTKVDHHCSENPCTTAQLLTWEGADRGPVTNGPVPPW